MCRAAADPKHVLAISTSDRYAAHSLGPNTAMLAV
jgi:hypothetical protein